MTPCIKVCQLNNGLCVGCLRTVNEITNWGSRTMSERMEMMKQLKGQTTTHECPGCNTGTYCAVEAGHSANLCWCMSVSAKPNNPLVESGAGVCLCRSCLCDDKK